MLCIFWLLVWYSFLHFVKVVGGDLLLEVTSHALAPLLFGELLALASGIERPLPHLGHRSGDRHQGSFTVADAGQIAGSCFVSPALVFHIAKVHVKI